MAGPGLIIGLGHRKRVGKDTFADFLDEALSARGWWVIKQPFALLMKEAANDLFSWGGLRDATHYDLIPENREAALPRLGKSPRQIWIEFGNALRAIHPDVWVENQKSEIEWYCGQFKDGRKIAVIVPDVRFPNEAAAIKSWGGTLVKVRSRRVPHSDDPADSALANFRAWDHIVVNDSHIEFLKEAAVRLVNKLVNKPEKETSGITS